MDEVLLPEQQVPHRLSFDIFSNGLDSVSLIAEINTDLAQSFIKKQRLFSKVSCAFSVFILPPEDDMNVYYAEEEFSNTLISCGQFDFFIEMLELTIQKMNMEHQCSILSDLEKGIKIRPKDIFKLTPEHRLFPTAKGFGNLRTIRHDQKEIFNPTPTVKVLHVLL